MRFRRKNKKSKEEKFLSSDVQNKQTPFDSPIVPVQEPVTPIRNVSNSPTSQCSISRSRRSRSTSSTIRHSFEMSLEMVLSPGSSTSTNSRYFGLPADTPPPQSPSSVATSPSPYVTPLKSHFVSTLPTTPQVFDDLLAELRKGRKLRSVSADSRRPSKDPRDDMMAQIRMGTPLKHVELQPRKIIHPITEADGIAGALAKALDNRRNTMVYDHSSDEENEENNDDEWTDVE